MRILFPPGRLVSAVRAILAATCSTVGLAHAATADLPPGWWRDAVFYEIFVRSFADAKSGPLAGDGIGDLQGAIEHLDYLNDGRGANGTSLGITAMWLMPVQPSPSYHGYDVTDYFSVNPQFGDVALMKRFVEEAHRRGIRVIVDFVLNHSSSEHPLFREAVASPESAARRMFRFADLPHELFGPWDQRAWHPSGDDFYYGVFSPEMPDWNFEDPAVTEHHRRAAAFWLHEIGVDGLRLDAVRYFVEVGRELQDTAATRQWLKEFTEFCHSVKPNSFVVAENTAHMEEVARTIRGRSVDSSFEFELARATIEAVRLRTPGILVQALQRLDELYAGQTPWSTFLTNHDQERTLTQFDGNVGLTRLATKVMFTLPGVTFLYYGEELGMSAGKPDPELRTPMPWTGEAPNGGFTAANVTPWKPLKPDFNRINAADEAKDPSSMQSLYRKLIRLDAASPALRRGKRVPVSSSERRVYAEMRATADESILVVANFANTPIKGARVTIPTSAVRRTWQLTEELEGVAVTSPAVAADGSITDWSPLAELSPESLYIFKWKR